MKITEQFDQYEVTNGQFRMKKGSDLQAPTKLGCTGALSIESETKTVTKKCEGKTAREVVIVEKLNGTFTGHLPVGVLRNVYGLTNENLAQGVHGYATTSVGGRGLLTFDVYDLGRENHKFIAFPNMNWTGSLKFSLTNGQEEIAEVEITFSAYADENNMFYYEAFEDDLTDENIKKKWHTEFAAALVKKPGM